jgi:malonyl-CoA O-methyltransferase
MIPEYVLAATRDGLMARLEPMTVDASIVVDLGSAYSPAGRLLEKRFKRARVVNVDLSLPLLARARSSKTLLSKSGYVQAAATALPFADHSVDIVYANQLLPWHTDPAPVLAEVTRVLRKDGLFVFSTLGPDSLQGLLHEPFADMHIVGDALVRAGLRDPVLDVDWLTVTFENVQSLIDDFEAVDAGHCVPADAQISSVAFEIVYGHCWGPGARPGAGEYRLDPAQIGRRKN